MPGKKVSPPAWPIPEGGYSEIKIGDLFTASPGNVDIQNKDIDGQGHYFINSGVTNQGVKGKTSRSARVFPSNTITIDFFGNAYYRPYEYVLATHNHVFSFSGNILKNRRIGLYIVGQMSYLSKIFAYNNMATISKLYECTIRLPLTKQNTIDYGFMESRIRELEESRIRELEAYLSEAGFDNCTLSETEASALNILCSGKLKTGLFQISTIFTLVKGKRLTRANILQGDINFIGATDSNNGITAHISNSTHIHNGNLITVSYNGSVGNAFYQPFPFWASDDINVFYPNFEMDETIALYFLAPLTKIGKLYGYSYKWTKEKMGNDYIPLPVTSSGNIDWNYISSLVSAIKKEAVISLKKFIQREHEAYISIIE